MEKRAVFEPGDRVRKGEELATVVYFHGKHDRVTVLPDDRSRSQGAVVWDTEGLEKIGRLTWKCPVCGGNHLIYYCPERA